MDYDSAEECRRATDGAVEIEIEPAPAFSAPDEETHSWKGGGIKRTCEKCGLTIMLAEGEAYMSLMDEAMPCDVEAARAVMRS